MVTFDSSSSSFVFVPLTFSDQLLCETPWPSLKSSNFLFRPTAPAGSTCGSSCVRPTAPAGSTCGSLWVRPMAPAGSTCGSSWVYSQFLVEAVLLDIDPPHSIRVSSSYTSLVPPFSFSPLAALNCVFFRCLDGCRCTRDWGRVCSTFKKKGLAGGFLSPISPGATGEGLRDGAPPPPAGL